MNSESDPQSVDDGIRNLLSSGKEKTIRLLEQWEDGVRRHPAKAILGAVGAGYLLHRLPVRSLLASGVKVAGSLTPPALLAYGAAKLCEILQQKTPRGPDAEPGSPFVDPGIR